MYTTYAAIRDTHNLRDSDVAKMTGITPSTFSDWKAGLYKPKADKLLKIATALGVTIEDLLTEKKKEEA